MTQPSYTTDLTDVVTADNNTNWYEMTGYTGGGADAAETDYFIQGTGCVSQAISGKTGVQVGLEYRSGADVTGFTDNTDVFLFWQVVLAGNAMDTFANGGLRIYIGSSTGNTNGWKSGGSDFGRNPYGGWQNVAIDPQQSTDYTQGSATASNYQIYCSQLNMVSAVSKGNMHALDAIRWGRAEILLEYGDATNGYVTFDEASRANDANDVSFTGDTTNSSAVVTNIATAEVDALYPGAPLSGTGIPGSTNVQSITSTTSITMTNNATATNTAVSITSQPYNRWGLLQDQAGSYLWKGLMTIGTATNAVDMRDSNRIIFVDDTPVVYAAFNRIEVNNTSSNVDWTSISITAPRTSITGSVVSRGQFEVVDNATVAKNGCTFTDMSTFVYNDGTNSNTLTDTTYRRCGKVTTGGATFTGCSFEETRDTATAVTASSPANAAKISNSTFISEGTKHGLEITGTAANCTLTGLVFEGYDTADPGTAANKAIYVNIATGTMTISISGGSGVTEDYHVRSAGATVTVSASITLTFTPLIANSEVRIYLTGTNTEVDGVENSTTSFAAGVTPSVAVDYKIINPGYEEIFVKNQTYTVSQNVNVNQQTDRNFTEGATG